MEFDGTVLDEETLYKLDEKKTGKLIEAAVISSALLCSSAEKKSTMSSYAKYAGLAFQLADDLLDADKNEPANFVTAIGYDETKKILVSLSTKAASILSKWGDSGKKLLDFFTLLSFRKQ